jgi:hypothetical protein
MKKQVSGNLQDLKKEFTLCWEHSKKNLKLHRMIMIYWNKNYFINHDLLLPKSGKSTFGCDNVTDK